MEVAGAQTPNTLAVGTGLPNKNKSLTSRTAPSSLLCKPTSRPMARLASGQH